jgi:hypothetical protein
MVPLALILLLVAFVLFFLAAMPTVITSRVNLTAAGLACWVLSHVVSGWK